jgi:hypothetical protein
MTKTILISILLLSMFGSITLLGASPTEPSRPPASDAADRAGDPVCEAAAEAGAGEADEAMPMACVDLYCEWRDKCANTGGGGYTTWKEEYCFTSCGHFFYNTGEKCCYRTQPGSC